RSACCRVNGTAARLVATNAARAQDSSPKSSKLAPKKGNAWAASSVCPVALVLKCQPIGTFHVQRLRTTCELAEHCPMMASLAFNIPTQTELDLP
ncbi:hypothetical protein, partial [Mesorhizobium sp. M0244]|uniref:hypothetical protein n=1 Tax=Mesorhizobium sp. M0244 TaxID=2956926 RepID=UPI00333D2F23